MEEFRKILDSFSVKDTLNPKVWDNYSDPEKSKLKKNIKNKLEEIAEEFIDSLEEDVFVEDIVLTGSLSNFNWSNYSDFDVHIIVDYNQFDENSDLYKKLFDLKKMVFNYNHEIKIYGFDVELYVQDIEEEHIATGVYSIMNDEWIETPKKMENKVDKEILSKKVKSWIKKINKAIKTKDTEDDEKILKNIKDRLKKYRKSGLEKGGELSYENLVFKFLRRSGHIEKLFDIANQSMDKKFSIESLNK